MMTKNYQSQSQQTMKRQRAVTVPVPRRLQPEAENEERDQLIPQIPSYRDMQRHSQSQIAELRTTDVDGGWR